MKGVIYMIFVYKKARGKLEAITKAKNKPNHTSPWIIPAIILLIFQKNLQSTCQSINANIVAAS
uniref:Uncharacterized protein n=1 Tax=Rhizophora mucronata TaxID=61149 RepID=A0A2P2Q852_RHIMU